MRELLAMIPVGLTPGDIIALNGRQWPVFQFGDDIMMAGEYIKMNVEAFSVVCYEISGKHSHR